MPRFFQRRSVLSLLIGLLLAACALQPSPSEVPANTPYPGIPTITPNPAQTGPAPAATSLPATVQPGAPHPGGPLWVANAADGTLRVIDPSDNSTAVIIPTGLKPDRVLLGEGAAWALDPTNGALIQVDPQTYTIRGVAHFDKQALRALAVGGGSVWVGVLERADFAVLQPKEEYHPAGGVLRIDPASGKTTGYAKIGPVLDLAFSGGALWALTRGDIDTPLFRLDPATLSAAPIVLSGTPDWLLADAFAPAADGLWIFSNSFGKLYHTDPAGRVISELNLGQNKPASGASTALLEAFGSVWLAAPWNHLLRIDPLAMKVVSELSLADPVGALVENSAALWALSPLSASAYRIDPQGSQVSATVPLGSAVQPTPVLTPTAVYRAYAPCEDSPLSRLKVGMHAVTPSQPALPNRLHKEDFKDSEIAGYIQPGQRVDIVEGPFCNDTEVWWRVRVPASGASGWAAEGDAGNYWLIPVP